MLGMVLRTRYHHQTCHHPHQIKMTYSPLPCLIITLETSTVTWTSSSPNSTERNAPWIPLFPNTSSSLELSTHASSIQWRRKQRNTIATILALPTRGRKDDWFHSNSKSHKSRRRQQKLAQSENWSCVLIR